MLYILKFDDCPDAASGAPTNIINIRTLIRKKAGIHTLGLIILSRGIELVDKIAF
ncbi:hypothetical protein CTE07_34360 [Chitinophaga terrae (ex Kim and Jung 2007)]|nr:hypothetical protein CTE07_34360 [Chitinophaga terrae (ex Kim and Jung 2007)]